MCVGACLRANPGTRTSTGACLLLLTNITSVGVLLLLYCYYYYQVVTVRAVVHVCDTDCVVCDGVHVGFVLLGLFVVSYRSPWASNCVCVRVCKKQCMMHRL